MPLKERVMGKVKDLLMDILRMYNQGWTVSEISDYTGVSAVEVERLLSVHEVV
jgi:DNA-binding transcriptional regulator LsrR (DeoR family)